MSPRYKLVRCEECAGTGEVEDDPPSADSSGTLVCSNCDGTGEIEVEDDEN